MTSLWVRSILCVIDSTSTPPPSQDPSPPSSPISPTSQLLDAWNPMSHDFQSFRNAYSIQTDNLDVAITGYGRICRNNIDYPRTKRDVSCLIQQNTELSNINDVIV